MAVKPGRRERLLDAAIELVGAQGLTGLTHRAVDAAADVPTGTTSNYWRTRQALLDALIDRVVARERDRWEQLTQATFPSTARELAGTLAVLARVATGPDRALVLARYALLIEAAQHGVHERAADAASLMLRQHAEGPESERRPLADPGPAADDVPDDSPSVTGVGLGDDRKPRHDVAVLPQLVDQCRLGGDVDARPCEGPQVDLADGAAVGR